MSHKESLQKVLDHIDENLYADFNLDRLAAVAGYSKYHFLRLNDPPQMVHRSTQGR